ncbi:hypothetical protein CTI12_AA376480 [Artemisia annua]|uniref:Uncharacterized protein n=1 Tax=Artemisia annua TaxID=35608 RepID=A0A2U1MHS0_ARTAN|nr:hypothetical protein CTI12_AA376480 [Artemisia annua]
MLSNVLKGPESFVKLMTINKKLCATFKEACFAYGLLNDDMEWTHAITEVGGWAFGPQLRDTFVTILLFCDVSRPLKLWEASWNTLSEDILHKKRKIFKHGRSLADFKDLPRPDPRLLNNMDNCLIREALDFDMKKSAIEHQQLHSLLNLEQRSIYEEVIESVHNGRASGERYYLRMLSNVLKGPKSFVKLMTINKKLCATFKEACFAYGLLNDDKEWTHAITEIGGWAFGPKLRDTFVTILLFCDVSRPLKLREASWNTVSEDILHKKRKLFKYPNLQLTDDQLRNYCLMEVQDILNRHGRSLADFKDLPRPDPRLLNNMDNRLIREALDFDMKKRGGDLDLIVGLLYPNPGFSIGL